MLNDYIYCCDVHTTLIFLRAFNKLHEVQLVQLMGGKGGLNSCGYCNRARSIKKSPSCKRDEITLEAVKMWVRIHLEQQLTGRQHADTFLEMC